MLPIGSRRRRLLYQSTHSKVANSTASMLRHGPRRRITSVANRPLIVSASALSYESPTLPAEGSIPASKSRSVYRIATYCPGSTGHRNTCLRRPQHLIKGLGRRSPAERLARPAVERRGHGREVIRAVPTQVRPLREVLPEQPIRVLVRAALPRAVRIAEVHL